MIKRFLAIACAISITGTVLASCGSATEDTAKSALPVSMTEAPAETKAPEETKAPKITDAPEVTETYEPDDQGYIDELTGLECCKPHAGYKPVTDFEGYDAFLMYASAPEKLWKNMAGQGYPEETRGDGAYGIDADITEDGTYKVSITKESICADDPIIDSSNVGSGVLVDESDGIVFPSTGPAVFCVDITGICDGTTDADGKATKQSDRNKLYDGDNAGTDPLIRGEYTGQEITVTLDSIKADGAEVPFDPDKIVYGNIEPANNRYRIEIYNADGRTGDDPPIDKDKLMFAKSLEVTFTITGLITEEDESQAEEAEEEVYEE